MLRRCLSLLTGLALVAAAPAAAEWREASSEHFLIYADTSEKWLREFAERLEKFDAGLRLRRGMDTPPEARSNRLVIYVVDNVQQVQRLYGSSSVSVGGFYVPRVGGSIAYTPRVSEYMVSATIVLQHEYAHHFLLSNFAAAYPRWLSEGFAELYSTATVERDGSLAIGRPAVHRAGSLMGGPTFRIERLLDPEHVSGDRHWDAFYGRAWLLMHMVSSDPARLEQLERYIGLVVGSGKPSVEAAREAFGDLAVLQRDMERYLARNRFGFFRIPAAALELAPIAVRTLGPGEAAMMPVRMRSDRGVTREQALALIGEARERAARYPNDPRVQGMLAEAEFDAGFVDAAEAACDRALAVDPADRQALLYKGQVRVARAMAAPAATPQMWAEARSWFIKANKLDNDAAEPLALFYLSFRQANAVPTRNAVLALERAFQLSPQDWGLRWMLARQLLVDERLREARVVLLPLAYNPHANAEVNPAMRLIELLDAGGTGAKALETLEATGPGAAPANPVARGRG